MILFDSHAHLDDEKFQDDLEQVVSKIQSSPVQYVVNVGATVESSKKSVELAQKHDFLYAAVGVHPCDADTLNETAMREIEQLAVCKKVVAIGESGLDYYWDNVDRSTQKRAFIWHIELANRLGLPLIVHNRDAHGDVLELLSAHRPQNAIIHCFSGSAETARLLSERFGYYISFSGSVTFKNAKQLPEAVKCVPYNRLLIETDSPYLSPEPKRGVRNDPTHVEYTMRRIAEILDETPDFVAKLTLENAKTVYNIKS